MPERTRLLRRSEVEELTAMSKPAIYKRMNTPSDPFPRPVKIGVHGVRWRADEVREWIASRPRATGEAEAA